MTDFLDGINGFLTAEEEAEIVSQFVKDNFCPYDRDPLTHDCERDWFLDEHTEQKENYYG